MKPSKRTIILPAERGRGQARVTSYILLRYSTGRTPHSFIWLDHYDYYTPGLRSARPELVRAQWDAQPSHPSPASQHLKLHWGQLQHTSFAATTWSLTWMALLLLLVFILHAFENETQIKSLARRTLADCNTQDNTRSGVSCCLVPPFRHCFRPV